MIADHTLQKAIDTYKLANVHEDDIAVVRNAQELEIAILNGKICCL